VFDFLRELLKSVNENNFPLLISFAILGAFVWTNSCFAKRFDKLIDKLSELGEDVKGLAGKIDVLVGVLNDQSGNKKCSLLASSTKFNKH